MVRGWANPVSGGVSPFPLLNGRFPAPTARRTSGGFAPDGKTAGDRLSRGGCDHTGRRVRQRDGSRLGLPGQRRGPSTSRSTPRRRRRRGSWGLRQRLTAALRAEREAQAQCAVRASRFTCPSSAACRGKATVGSGWSPLQHGAIARIVVVPPTHAQPDLAPGTSSYRDLPWREGA